MIVSQIPAIQDGLSTWLCENGTAALSSFKGEAGKWETPSIQHTAGTISNNYLHTNREGKNYTCTCSFVWIQPHLVFIEYLYLYFLVSWEILA